MIPIYEADRLEDLPLFDRPPQAEEDVDAPVRRRRSGAV